MTLWSRLEREHRHWLTSNLVLSEAFTLLARRTSYAFAADTAGQLYASQRVQIVRSEVDEELIALKLFAKLADQQVSFTDCVSFALMDTRRVVRAFTFDRHFSVAGFRVIPGYGEAGWVMERPAVYGWE